MGSLRRKSNGWEIRYYADGKQVAKTIKGTKREADAILAGIERDISQGVYRAPTRRVTTGELLSEWLLDAGGRLAPSSRRRYEIAVRTRLTPALGGKALKELSPRDIQLVYNTWREEGMAPSSLKLCHAALCSALDYALRMEMIARNPAVQVKTPTVIRKARGILEADQIRELLQASRGRACRMPVALAVTAGLRVGEICGLRWSDVDFEERALVVTHSVTRLGGGRGSIGGTKTPSSRRSVSLGQIAIDAILSLPRDSELILHRNGDPVDPNTVAAQVRRLLRSLGMASSIHGLRHTHASLLFRMGVHPKLVSERLGHSRISMTLDAYTHVLPSQQKALADIVDKVFET